MNKNNNIRIRQATKLGYVVARPGTIFDCSYPTSANRRGRVQLDDQGRSISPTVTTQVESCLLLFVGWQ